MICDVGTLADDVVACSHSKVLILLNGYRLEAVVRPVFRRHRERSLACYVHSNRLVEPELR